MDLVGKEKAPSDGLSKAPLNLLADEELNIEFTKTNEDSFEKEDDISITDSPTNSPLFHHFKAESPSRMNKRTFSKIVSSIPPSPHKTSETQRLPHSPHSTPSKCKRCKCKNSRCLKSYCVCFASSLYCSDCYCEGCCNTIEHAELVEEARRLALERDPLAFDSKIDSLDNSLHKKGCKCTRTNCLKKYCECYRAGVVCGENCKCTECKNHEGGKELSQMHVHEKANIRSYHNSHINHQSDYIDSIHTPLFNTNSSSQLKTIRNIFSDIKLKDLASDMYHKVKEKENTLDSATITENQEEVILKILGQFLENIVTEAKK